jgi:hypothetical protein
LPTARLENHHAEQQGQAFKNFSRKHR